MISKYFKSLTLNNARLLHTFNCFRVPLEWCNDLNNQNFDSTVIIASKLEDLKSQNLQNFLKALQVYKEHNKSFDRDITFCISNDRRVIYSPTGPLDRDFDDVRRVKDAAVAGIRKAVSIGSKKPLLVNCTNNYYKLADNVALLSALQTAYVPYDVRREPGKSEMFYQVEKLGFYNESETSKQLTSVVEAIECGRYVSRDIAGTDPEVMSPPHVADYVRKTFEGTSIKLDIVENVEELEKNYPCFAAVNRAAHATPRHRGRLIKLVYESPDAPEDQTLFLVGKGITYDTGGADVKHGGAMAGMHRDKSGAAFVAGFFKVLDLLKPKGIKVYGFMCMARNSIGEESFVADEIITSRANVRVRIVNTDAEGRLVMTDPLCESKEIALNSVNPEIFTIATLTGHVIRCYGPNYSAILSNQAARKKNIDSELLKIGDEIADPYEISTIKREDFEFHSGISIYEDVMQANNLPSTMTARGHQGPAAYLIMASGLDKHGINSSKPIPYSHCDIAGSSQAHPDFPNGAPLLSFVHKYVLPRCNLDSSLF